MPLRTPGRRAVGPLLAAVALVGVLGGCGQDPRPPAAALPTALAPTVAPLPTTDVGEPRPAAPRTSPTPQPTTTGVPDGSPVHVTVVSAVDGTLVDASVTPQGLDEAGVLSPPSGLVGWYDEPGWPRPGLPGASILAGHVGTPSTGPDTFSELPQARPGDRVTVTYDTGDLVHFVVRRSAGLPKEVVPADDSIWDAGNPEPLLRLITCDPRTPLRAGHYEGNWVLWADLV